MDPRDLLAQLLNGLGQGLGQTQPPPSPQAMQGGAPPQPYLPPEELLRLQMGGQGPQPALMPEQILQQQMAPGPRY